MAGIIAEAIDKASITKLRRMQKRCAIEMGNLEHKNRELAEKVVYLLEDQLTWRDCSQYWHKKYLALVNKNKRGKQ